MPRMTRRMVVAGGGIGGLAAALACAQDGWTVDLLEQATEFGEVGAGIQLGPNVTHVLHAWGLEEALEQVAAFPQRLQVRNAMTGAVLGVLPLGEDMQKRYGSPYVTVARQDIHSVLLQAVRQQGTTQLHLNARVIDVQDESSRAAVSVDTVQDEQFEADVLVGADGLWSQVRNLVLGDGGPRVTGHLAFRAMLPQADLPAALRTQDVTAWLGTDFHAVQYPVRRGEWLNMVCIVHGTVSGDPSHWDHSANASELRERLSQASQPLRDMVCAIDHWRLWALCDRPPMTGAHQHAKGRVALLGDAAHPMRPYLAQGAGMAIEDAHALASALQENADVAQALQLFATRRWQRNAHVQARAIRNGEIFHMHGPMRLARDLAIRTLGQRLLDVPWLYAGG